MYPFRDRQKEAAEKLAALMAKPVPETAEDAGWDERFDPWETFSGSLYGSYSGAFDHMAITVLRNIQSKRWGGDHGETLAHEMFREMLCVADLCDYGVSPRGCFPTLEFEPLLPALIEKWEAYADVMWDGEWRDGTD